MALLTEYSSYLIENFGALDMKCQGGEGGLSREWTRGKGGWQHAREGINKCSPSSLEITLIIAIIYPPQLLFFECARPI